MKLKGLEMQGFKSFPDKTLIYVDNGITAVVGPNGSGKSNISDAVRWVLGEMSLKSLRGSRMEDVIFAGSDKRTAANCAIVSLYLDKDDGSGEETIVTRKYYRSGESEYYLDKKQVRLKDVYEAFYDTGIGREGYSVIGQGKIAEVLSQKGDERRSIFEEAAGISKFRYKKQESERKLAATEDNLLRVQDIMGEVGSRLAPLEKEAENAKKYLALSEEKKGLEISLWLDKIDSIRAELSQSDKLLAGAAESLSAAEDKIKELESRSDDLYLNSNEMSKDISLAEREISGIGLKISEAEGKKALKSNDINHFESLISESKAEIANTESEKKRLEESIEAADEDIATAETAVANAKAEFETKGREYAELRNVYDSKTVERSELQSSYTAALEKRSALSVEHAALKVNLENVRHNAETSAEEIYGFESRIASLTEKLDKIRAELEKANGALAEAEEKHKSKAEALATEEKQLENKKAAGVEISLAIASYKQQKENLLRMEALLEGYSDSVKNVIGAAKDGKILCKSKTAVLHGTVSSVISTDEKYVVALETALGAAVQHVIVDDEEDAKACIRYLKETGGGRASFLPISTVRGPRANDNAIKDCGGYIGIGCDLCKYDAKYKDIFTKLLGETVVASDIDSAAVIAKRCGYRLRVVTLDGQVIHQGGSFTGGSAAKRVGILTRSIDIERLTGIIAKREEDLARNTESQEKIQMRIDSLRADWDNTEMAVTITKSKRDSLTNAASMEKVRLEDEQRRYNQFVDTNGNIAKQLAELTVKSEEAETRLKVAEEEAEKLSSALALAVRSAENAEKASSSAYEELSKSRLAVVEKENALARTKEKRLSITERCKNMEARKRECELSVQNALMQIEQRRKEIEALNAEEAEYDKEKAVIGERIAKLIAGKEENDKQSIELRQAIREANSAKEDAFRHHTALQSRGTTLAAEYEEYSNKLWEEYELTYSTALQFRLPEENMKKASTRLNSLKGQIRAMGSINVNAVEEFKETKERYDFLSSQVADLNESRKSLDNAIAKLEANMKTAFTDTFAQINTAFGEVFGELFGGGTAKCILEDEANPLTCGIDIVIRPPGKSVKNINLLSGGEQSFAAVALYLALQRINPAPFCIFDEIESALDDVNVTRLANYLKSNVDATQFIMITHRRGTMEKADVIYGITMKEKGVSDYIKLDIRALEQNIT